jgi:hypothetical protein
MAFVVAVLLLLMMLPGSFFSGVVLAGFLGGERGDSLWEEIVRTTRRINQPIKPTYKMAWWAFGFGKSRRVGVGRRGRFEVVPASTKKSKETVSNPSNRETLRSMYVPPTNVTNNTLY